MVWSRADPILLVLYVSERQFEKHGSSERATSTSKATSGQVINEPEDDDSFLAKLTSLKRKIFG